MIEEILSNMNFNIIDFMNSQIDLIERTKPKKTYRKIRYSKGKYKKRRGIFINPFHEFFLTSAKINMLMVKHLYKTE